MPAALGAYVPVLPITHPVDADRGEPVRLVERGARTDRHHLDGTGRVAPADAERSEFCILRRDAVRATGA